MQILTQHTDKYSILVNDYFLLEGTEIENHQIKICIIADNKQTVDLIEGGINERSNFELVGVAGDGEAGEKLLHEKDFDVAIIDAILPYRDGISLLANYKASEEPEDLKKVYIMLTGVDHKALTQNAFDNGADYIFLKPFDTDILIEKILELYYLKVGKYDTVKKPGLKKRTEITNFTDDLLNRLEIHSNLKGYLYLRLAIIKTIENKGKVNSITKILYPFIAKESASTPSRVERVIRHAINESWTPDSGIKYARLLANDAFLVKKPSNKAFISAAAEAYERARTS